MPLKIKRKNTYFTILLFIIIVFWKTDSMAMECEEHKSWHHDDQNLRSYTIDRSCTKKEEELPETKRSKKYNSYVLESISLNPMKTPEIQRGLPVLQCCQMVKMYKRPDHTIFELSEICDYPISLSHNGFYYDNDNQVAYQTVNLHVKHNDTVYKIGKEFRLERSYPYQRQFLRWEDNEQEHVSRKIETIFIQVSHAVDQDNIKSQKAIIHLEKRNDTEEEVQHHRRGLFMWEIPHSGKWYG